MKGDIQRRKGGSLNLEKLAHRRGAKDAEKSRRFSKSPSWQLTPSNRLIALIALTLVFCGQISGQTPAVRNFVGTVTALKTSAGDLEVKPDNAPPMNVSFTPQTIFLKVAPGVTDLKKAEAIQANEVAMGDRVLVTIETATHSARRIIVMSAGDIAKRNEAERLNWIRRGVSGIVASKKDDQITLKMRTLQGATEAVVTVTPQTLFKRYAPDSVKFADAQPSTLAEVSVGDQLRARGQKNEDGLKVMADEVVFGTFLIKAGTVTSVDAAARELTVKDLSTGKPLLIKISPDSQIKAMPDFAEMMGGGRPGFRPQGENAARAPARNGGPGGNGPRRPGGRFDISQMLERMPATTLDQLKPGEDIVVSSTKGARSDQITAIMLVAHADMIIRMATAQSNGMNGRGMNMGMNGMNGFEGIQMPTMIQ